MLFSAWQFIFVFLPVVAGVFALMPARWRAARKAWLSVASLAFYAYWKVEHVPLLLVSVLLNRALAELLLQRRDRAAGRWMLAAGVLINLMLLGYFKYTNFVLSAVGAIVRQDLGRVDIVLPLAISFFTFTQVAYLVDVYRDHTRHYRLLDYLLFVVFFPHLIAGPIVRHWEIIPQYADRDLRPAGLDIGTGLLLFLIGLYKKLLLADPVSRFADVVYGAAATGAALTWFDAWLGTLAFALQIYFDFSGYSDMAIGLARMFGIRFPCNFDSPYRAGSIAEFWSRWHITLTRFFREYVYFTLGGNRVSRWRHGTNIMVTMLLSGLWHGPGWTFVIWGGLHGAMLVTHHRWRAMLASRGLAPRHWTYRTAGVLLTFVAVLFTWVLFRAPDLATAGAVLGGMTGAHGVTAPAELYWSSGIAAVLLDLSGATVVTASIPLTVDDYRLALFWLPVLMVIVFAMPNSQQLLADYEPTIEGVQRPGWFRLSLDPLTGFAFGLAFLWVVRGYFVLPQSPFIYFNF